MSINSFICYYLQFLFFLDVLCICFYATLRFIAVPLQALAEHLIWHSDEYDPQSESLIPLPGQMYIQALKKNLFSNSVDEYSCDYYSD